MKHKKTVIRKMKTKGKEEEKKTKRKETKKVITGLELGTFTRSN